jgi:hypothetical protein
MREIRQRLLSDPDSCGSVAIVGLPRIGKTSLVLNALKYAPGEVLRERRAIICRVVASTFRNADDLWRGIATTIADELSASNTATSATLSKELESAACEDARPFYRLCRGLKQVRRDGFRAICIIDEFDTVRNLFGNDGYRFNQVREFASDPEIGVGLALISKRPLETLSSASENNYWKNTLHEIRLRGVEGVLDLMSARDDALLCDLDPAVRADLIQLTNGHPYLTELCLFHVWELLNSCGRCDVRTYRIACRDCLRRYWEQVHDVLATSRVSSGNTTREPLVGANPEGSFIHKYLQIILGPAIDVTKEDKMALEDYGVVRRAGETGGELSSFSSGFEDFASRVIERDAPLWSWWTDCERAMRSSVAQLLRSTHGEDWQVGLRGVFGGLPDGVGRDTLLKDLDEAASRRSQEEALLGERRSESILDFYSPRPLFRLMKHDWEVLGRRLLGGEKSDWEQDFHFLASIRNLPAHSREHVLTADERSRAQRLCARILDHCRELDKSLSASSHP